MYTWMMRFCTVVQGVLFVMFVVLFAVELSRGSYWALFDAFFAFLSAFFFVWAFFSQAS